MLDLDNPTWDGLDGGYLRPYNPVSALRRLEGVANPKEESGVYKDLWDELHHQGDLGECSYACVPLEMNELSARTFLREETGYEP